MRLSLIGRFKKLWDEEGKARSFEKLGHEVSRYEEESLINAIDLDPLFAEKPDAIIFAKLKSAPPVRGELIRIAKQLKVLTVCWVPDLYWGLPRQFLIGNDPIFEADLVLTPDGGHDDAWGKKGVNHHLLRQAIFDEDCFMGDIKPFPEIVFVGRANPGWAYREELDLFLKERYGAKYERFGKLDSDHMRGKDLNDLYASAKIVVGDSVASPYYWSNRIYETIGRGGFIIHPLTEGLAQEFTPYKHFIPYHFEDFEGLAQKIDYFLTHDDERRQISQAGMKHCKENHTLLNRCEELICFLQTIQQKK